jgi:osmotically-inducible protein OsmY
MPVRIPTLIAYVLLAASSAVAAGANGPALADVRDVVRETTIRRDDTVFNFIEVAVDGDVVTLTGTVRHAGRGKQIEREVAKIKGVRAVRNQLHSPQDGAGDERLRRQLVRSIYGHSALSRYGRLLDPPIRILVEKGKVVIAGLVSSRVEREMLTQIALRSEAFGVENEVAVDAEVANQPLAPPR